MTMPSQKYANVVRTVSGPNVPVFNTDLQLAVNTSSTACSINLDAIPAGYWNTTWKLYIYDLSNNASVNNITINAGTGQTINGSSSITINTNGGSALIRIVSNTMFIATLSSTAGGTSTLPYLFAIKNLQTALTTYVGVAASGFRSVVSGLTMTNYDSKTEVGVSGFNLTTGLWTVPSNGIYNINAKLITRINDTDINSNLDSGGSSWMTGGNVGFVGIGIIKNSQVIVTSNKQAITAEISDINIECTQEVANLSAADTIEIKILNKMNHDINGIPAALGLQDCYVELSVEKIA